MLYYRVYGYILESNARIPELVPARPGLGPDLRVDFGRSMLSDSGKALRLRLVTRERLACGEPFARLYESPTTYLLRYTHVAAFRLSKADQQVDVHQHEGAAEGEVRLFLLGGVLSFALELRGVPSLHASAVSVGGRGVAFLGDAHEGKSTLAASFVRAGYPLLTDDILPLNREGGQVLATSGYAQMRMWPDQAQHFLGHDEDLELVHPAYSKRRVTVGENGFGTFCDESQPLACLYLPERRDPMERGTEIDITLVSPRDAVIELVRHSFAASIVERLGLQPQRLDFFAQLVQHVPMRRLVYPSGFEHLPRVREAILEDLERLSRRAHT